MGIASKYNGNCLRMKNLELPDCHSATPYILPTSNRIVAKISNFLHYLAFDANHDIENCVTLFPKTSLSFPKSNQSVWKIV